MVPGDCHAVLANLLVALSAPADDQRDGEGDAKQHDAVHEDEGRLDGECRDGSQLPGRQLL